MEIKPLDSGRRQKSKKICSWPGSKSRVEKFLQSTGSREDRAARRKTFRLCDGVFKMLAAGNPKDAASLLNIHCITKLNDLQKLMNYIWLGFLQAI